MSKKKKNSDSQDQDILKKYLRGDASANEEHSIEKKSIDDAFLGDALEGMEDFHADDIIDDLEQIGKKIDNRSSIKTNRHSWLYRSVAAFLVLAVATSLVYLISGRMDTLSNQETITLKQDKINKEAEKYPEENTIENRSKNSESEKLPIEVKEENKPEEEIIISRDEINPNDLNQAEGEENEEIDEMALDQIRDEDINPKTVSVSIPETEKEIEVKLEQPAATLSQEFAIADDQVSEPTKKLRKGTNARSASPEISGVEITVENEEVLVPEPIGGMENYYIYLSDSINYPEDALRDEIEGTVIVQCSLLADSIPTNCIIVQPLHKSCDEEAIRLIIEGPKWKLAAIADPFIPQQILVEVAFRIVEK